MTRSFLRAAEGATAVEFALTSPVYFLALFGLAQVGLWLWADFSLQSAVNAASRCAALGTCAYGDAKAAAVRATVGLPISAGAFAVTSPSRGTQVAANYPVPTFIPALPNITVNVSACYPK